MSDYVPSSALTLSKSCISEVSCGKATVLTGGQDGVPTESGYAAGDEASFASEKSLTKGSAAFSGDSKEDDIPVCDGNIPVNEVFTTADGQQALEEGIGDTDDAHEAADSNATLQDGEEESVQQNNEDGGAADPFAGEVKNLKRKRLYADFGGF